MVTLWLHAMSDIDRMLPGMTMADKWPLWRQALNVMPSWMQGLLGIDASALIGKLLDENACP
jgi:hypothetical protein